MKTKYVKLLSKHLKRDRKVVRLYRQKGLRIIWRSHMAMWSPPHADIMRYLSPPRNAD